MDQILINIFSQPVFVATLVLWSILWKGVALWKAATKRQIVWFIIFLIINSLGLLEILYLFWLNRWDLGSEKVFNYIKEKTEKIKKRD